MVAPTDPSHADSLSPDILLCTADVGCGHARAAAAVALALRARLPHHNVPVIDALQHAPRWFTTIYRDAYLFGVNHLPRAIGALYSRTDIHGIPPHSGLASALERRALKSLASHPHIQSAHSIVCTHFLCARVLSALKQSNRLAASLSVIVTDQHPHAVWRSPHIDRYFVANAHAKSVMLHHGVPPQNVHDLGIPIDARFASPLSKLDARAKHKLPLDQPIILISGGGLGLGGLDHALDGVLAQRSNAIAIVVCGKNQPLYTSLAQRFANHSNRCRIFAHTPLMHELMAAADLIVCKPGGLTTAEATALALPMILLRPIPGQEEHNANLLVSANAARLEPNPFCAGQLAATIIHNPIARAAMHAAAQSLAKPAAAANIAAAILAPTQHLTPKPILHPVAQALSP